MARLVASQINRKSSGAVEGGGLPLSYPVAWSLVPALVQPAWARACKIGGHPGRRLEALRFPVYRSTPSQTATYPPVGVALAKERTLCDQQLWEEGGGENAL